MDLQKGYMPVCFLTTNDITGGNSGSPVMNGNGELIGLAFDGNWESMSGDIAYEPELQRTIVVDIRYVLWVMDIYAGAKNLVDEMTDSSIIYLRPMHFSLIEILAAFMVLFAIIDIPGSIPIIIDIKSKSGVIKSFKVTLVSFLILACISVYWKSAAWHLRN